VNTLAERITAELCALIGQPLTGCRRALNMQMFGFGPRHLTVNRRGEDVEVSKLGLHVQCPWRLVNGETIICGLGDLDYPGDPSIAREDFDWDKHTSLLDVAQRHWFASRLDSPPKVVSVHGGAFGGFRICLDCGVTLEAFPFDSRKDEYSERWRLFGHRTDGSHFVVTGYGIEGEGKSAPAS
jgi:hypothetical protein